MARVRAASAKREHWSENSSQERSDENVVTQCFWKSRNCSFVVEGSWVSRELSKSGGWRVAGRAGGVFGRGSDVTVASVGLQVGCAT